MTDLKRYQSPLSERYASDEMSFLFSPHYKFLTWRKLWVALAKAQKKLGLPITDKQITSLENAVEKIDFPKRKSTRKNFATMSWRISTPMAI